MQLHKGILTINNVDYPAIEDFMRDTTLDMCDETLRNDITSIITNYAVANHKPGQMNNITFFILKQWDDFTCVNIEDIEEVVQMFILQKFDFNVTSESLKEFLDDATREEIESELDMIKILYMPQAEKGLRC